MLDMKDINFPYLTVRAGKLSALLAASFVLPALAFAGSDNGKGNSGSNNGNQYGKGDKGGAAVIHKFRRFPRPIQASF